MDAAMWGATESRSAVAGVLIGRCAGYGAARAVCRGVVTRPAGCWDTLPAASWIRASSGAVTSSVCRVFERFGAGLGGDATFRGRWRW